jgi:DNA-directed RNA polymerase III subunit RPC2
MCEAMGVQSEQEIVQLIGSEPEYVAGITPSIQDCHKHGVFTQEQALNFLGSKIVEQITSYRRPRPKV